MKILITGHKGFVGRHFWKTLENKNNTLVGADIKENGYDCRTLFKTVSTKFDLVIHLAAVVGGRKGIENDPLAVAENLSIDAEFFKWAAKTKQKKIIYFSSSAVYPTFLQKKFGRALKESDMKFQKDGSVGIPDMTYGWAKLTGEVLAQQYTEKYNGKVYILRPFSGYGSHQDLDYPFPSFIDRAKKRKNPFIIWGNGRQVRDFIHIDDIVHATLKAVRNKVTDPINLGSGIPVSFKELGKMVTVQAGYSPEFKFLKNKPTGVSYRVADITKLKKFYTPKISLEEGIKLALKS